MECKFQRQVKFLEKKWKKFNKKQKQQFFDECNEYGLFIHQPPFYENISVENMIELYKEFGYNPYHMTVEGQEIEEPLIMGKLYFIRLTVSAVIKLL
jgi:hypothetical protein